MTKKDVVIVIDDKAIHVSRHTWELFHDCAGQMLSDGDHFDYYKGRVPKKQLEAVSKLYHATSRGQVESYSETLAKFSDQSPKFDGLCRSEVIDRPKGIAEKFATLVEEKDGWYRGSIDYKIENGEVTRVGELKVTLVGEQSPSVFFKQEAKGPPFPDPAISANKATVILCEAKGPPFPDPAIEDKWNLTWPSLKTRQKRGCRKRLAPGQWWAFCGETDMGQTAPALCTECGGEFKLEPVRQE